MGDDFYTGPREDGGGVGVVEEEGGGGKVYFLSPSLRMPGEVWLHKGSPTILILTIAAHFSPPNGP